MRGDEKRERERERERRECEKRDRERERRKRKEISRATINNSDRLIGLTDISYTARINEETKSSDKIFE